MGIKKNLANYACYKAFIFVSEVSECHYQSDDMKENISGSHESEKFVTLFSEPLLQMHSQESSVKWPSDSL